KSMERSHLVNAVALASNCKRGDGDRNRGSKIDRRKPFGGPYRACSQSQSVLIRPLANTKSTERSQLVNAVALASNCIGRNRPRLPIPFEQKRVMQPWSHPTS